MQTRSVLSYPIRTNIASAYCVETTTSKHISVYTSSSCRWQFHTEKALHSDLTFSKPTQSIIITQNIISVEADRKRHTYGMWLIVVVVIVTRKYLPPFNPIAIYRPHSSGRWPDINIRGDLTAAQ